MMFVILVTDDSEIETEVGTSNQNQSLNMFCRNYPNSIDDHTNITNRRSRDYFVFSCFKLNKMSN
jgi:hypothetical protein